MSRSCLRWLNLDMAVRSSTKQTSRTKPFEIHCSHKDGVLADRTLCVIQLEVESHVRDCATKKGSTSRVLPSSTKKLIEALYCP